MPGIIEDPGSLAGILISPNPDLGPEDKNRKSFRIFNNDTANVLNEFEKLTQRVMTGNSFKFIFCRFVVIYC